MMLSYGLVAGLSPGECESMAPGLILDLYVYRMQYDDMEHGVQRKKEPKWQD